MKIHKLYIVFGMLLAFALFFELAAHADENNQSTKITFSAPVQIPGQMLPAGTYIFRQAEPNDDLNLVQIFNADGRVLYATLQTIPAERKESTDHTAITLAEPESGKPDLLVKWFYPGSLTGHEFVYSQQQEQKVAQDQQQTFLGDGSVSSAEVADE